MIRCVNRLWGLRLAAPPVGDAAHCVMLDQPPAFQATLDRFLAAQ